MTKDLNDGADTVGALAPRASMCSRLQTASVHIAVPKGSLVQNLRRPCCPSVVDQKLQRDIVRPESGT